MSPAVTVAPPQLVAVGRLSVKNAGDRIRFVQTALVDGTIDHVLKSGKRRIAVITVDGVNHRLYLDATVEVTPGPGHDEVVLEPLPPTLRQLAGLVPAAATEPQESEERPAVRTVAGALDESCIGHPATLSIGGQEYSGILESIANGGMVNLTIAGVKIAVPDDMPVTVTPQHPLDSREAFDAFYENLRRLD